MNLEKRRNPFGGSAGGGGYDYQAEAYTLVAAKILAEEGLNWLETGCDRVPVSVRVETGRGGDDLRITLRSRAKIELQAKRGLKRGYDLWHALLALAQVVSTAPDIYGILLTTTDASRPIRVHLKDGITQVGQGIADEFHEIVEDFCKRLQDAGFKDLSICSRIRIVIRDLDPGSPGEEETLATLRKVIADPQVAGAARTVLVADGLDLIKLRGNRDASGLAKVLKQAPMDPVSTAAPFAADLLAEAEEPPPDLRDRVFQNLRPRLVSNVPMVVYESGERLRPIALANPALIGPLALELSRHGQEWTREVACALGLLCGNDYVNVDALLEVFPTASDSGRRSVRRHGIVLGEVNPLMRDLIIKGAEYLLGENAPACYLDIVKEKGRNTNCTTRTFEDLLEILGGHLPLEELRKIYPTWFARTEAISNAEVQQAVREADQALLETILMASEGLIHDERRSTTDPKMGSIAQLYQALKIGDFPMWEMYAWRQRPLQEALVEVIRGAILVNSLDPAQVKADAEQALHELAHPQNYLLRLIRDSLEFNSEIQMNWTLAQGQRPQPNLLLRALSHPSRFICSFAMQLLWECVERDIVRVGLKEVLRSGSGNALKIIAPNAAEIWQEEAADLVLDRLEQNLTEDGSPLVKALGELCGESSTLRAEVILRKALLSRDADMVLAALHAIEKLDLDETLSATIRACYRWWLHEGLQDPIGGGRVPENPAASLLSLLIANRQVSLEEVREPAHAKRFDVRDAAIKAMGQFLAEADELVEPTLDDIRRGNLPCRLVTELARSYPAVCFRHFEGFLGLLDSDDPSLQIACIWALAGGWAEKSEVEAKLQSPLNNPDTDVRDVVVKALRRLCEG